MRKQIFAIMTTTLLWSCSETNSTTDNTTVVTEENNTSIVKEINATNIFKLSSGKSLTIKLPDNHEETEYPQVDTDFLDKYIKTTPLFTFYSPYYTEENKSWKPTSSEFFHWGKINMEKGEIYLIMEKKVYSHDSGYPNALIAIFIDENGNKINALEVAHNATVGGDYHTNMYSLFSNDKIENICVGTGIHGYVEGSDAIQYNIDSVYKSYDFVEFGKNISLGDSSKTLRKEYK